MPDDHYFEFIADLPLEITDTVHDLDGLKLIKVCAYANQNLFVFENSFIHLHIASHSGQSGGCKENVNKCTITFSSGDSYVVLNLSRRAYQHPGILGQENVAVKGDLGCGPVLPTERPGGPGENFNLIRIPIGQEKYLPLPIGVHSGNIPAGSTLNLSTIYYPCNDTLATDIETVLNTNRNHSEWQVGINTLTSEGPSGLSIHDNSGQIWQ